jgi:type I restriction enzyme S subunit
VVSSSGITGYHNEPKVEAPGVVTGRYGTLGEVFYISRDFWPLNTTLFVCDFKGNDPLFISYFLQTLNLESRNVASSVPGLNRNFLHMLPVRIPSLLTQRKIASVLSAYDDLIENNTQRIAVLEEMAQRIYREWFVHFRFPGHEAVGMIDSKLGPIPQSWETGVFTDIADILTGGTPRTKVEEYWNGPIPFFSPKDINTPVYVLETERSITELGLENCSSDRYPRDTVFITARGTVGRVIMPAVPMAMNQTCYALRGRNGISQYYIFLNIRNQVERLQQRAHGAVFDTIIIDTFRQLEVVQAPRALIDLFHERVAPIFQQILNLLSRNAVLRHTRDLLLPRLVSGEVSVADLPIETNEGDV